MSRRQITLADLAKELGISTATVSRALKDYPDISPETKKKVLELARTMNYRPNSLAAGLRKRESRIIGVIIPSIVDHFFSSVIKGIMEVAYDAGYRVMLCQSDESYEKEVADAHALFDSRVDGILVSVAHGTEHYEHFVDFQETGIPIVFFDKVPANMDTASKVIVDDYEGAFRLVEHMIQQGFGPVAHFRGPMIASTSRSRYQGYADAMKAHHLEPDESLIYACQDITLEEGHAHALELIRRRPDCRGIFAVTDTVALGAMTGIKEAGLRIPADMAIAGFSDWKISAIVDPPLTTVAQPGLEMGRRATELLLLEIHAGKEQTTFQPETVILKTELKLRASTLKID